MWFNPAKLLTETASPSANFANLANLQNHDQQDTPKISRISEISSGLSAEHTQKLLAYLAAIEETDHELIQEYLTECAKNSELLAWALSWADKVLSAQVQPEQGLITCRSCQHWKCYNAHGGAGSCHVGVVPMGACHWSETAYDCGKYQAVRLKNA
jgi:hypothetical protein